MTDTDPKAKGCVRNSVTPKTLVMEDTTLRIPGADKLDLGLHHQARSRGSELISVFVRLSAYEAPQLKSAPDARWHHVGTCGNIWTLQNLPVSALAELIALPQVSYVESSGTLSLS